MIYFNREVEGMNQQIKLTPGRLLDDKGCLVQAGYATSMVKQYDRKDIKGHAFAIKEWDYYIVTDGHRAVALTVADNSYMSLVSASYLDLTQPRYKTTSKIDFFTFGKTGLPSTLEKGNVIYRSKRVDMEFANDGTARRLYCRFNDFAEGETLTCEFKVTDQPKEYMTIATPFKEKKHAFYYNAKVNCMTAEGYARLGKEEYLFDKRNSLATLDWGRGIWTYKNTWYWSSLQAYDDNGKTIGFNLGYGFGDTSAATENMLFYDKKAYKLNDVTFNIPKDDKGNDDFMSPWTFTSSDNGVDLTFTPVLDRKDITDLKVLASIQHQVFGYFNGSITAEGVTVKFDNKPGFAEKVFNKW